VHFTVGQPPPPANIIVQLPEQQGMSREQREFMMYALIWLVVAVVLTGCVCAVTVIVGGTLMGIIGVVSANIPMVAVSLAVVVLAVGEPPCTTSPTPPTLTTNGRRVPPARAREPTPCGPTNLIAWYADRVRTRRRRG